MENNKIKRNPNAKPNSPDLYVDGTVVVEQPLGSRLAFSVQRLNSYDPDGNVTRYVVIQTDDRGISYDMDDDTDLTFDDEAGTGAFTSRGVQYKIRALQDSDRSWVINYKPSTESKES